MAKSLREKTDIYLRCRHNTPGQDRAFVSVVATFRRDAQADYSPAVIAEMDFESHAREYLDRVSSDRR